ncbi:MAG: type II toxin-antitoxin system HicA family toxin [Methylococcaceae bacterium]|nr:MAG: type II toxin-antitoxin system HicA family toxin [Methylococcaceae bacterium]
MPKLSPVSWRDLVVGLRSFGFTGPFEGGKHPYMVHGDLVLTLPNPHRQEIAIDLLQRILQQAHISREAWLNTKR